MMITLLKGTLVTLALTISALGLGLILAFFITYGLNSPNIILKKLLYAFINFIRGVPLLVQFFLTYYGLAEFEWVRESSLWIVLESPSICATLILAMNSSAYSAILMQMIVQNIPKGEIEACQILHLSHFIMMREVILKRMLTSFWTIYPNEIAAILKCTALASTITLMELTGAARQVMAKSYQISETLLITAALYLLVALILINGFKILHCYFSKI